MAVSPLHDKDKSERKSDNAICKEARRRADSQCSKIENPFEKATKTNEAYSYWLNVVKNEQANLPEFKKPHYHVLYVASNPVTSDSVRRKLKRNLGDNCVSYVEIVDNVDYYYKYLTHESADAIAKNKHVYDSSGIVHLNGFDIDRYITLDMEQKKEVLLSLKQVICEFMIPNVIDLEVFLTAHGKEYGLDNQNQVMSVVRENVGYLRLYFDGVYQKLQRKHST